MLEYIIISLQSLPPEITLCLEYFICVFAIVGMVYCFGEAGLFSYISLAVVISNIQVLKTANLSFLTYPIALGTIVFSSTFLAIDILTEFYGEDRARKGVWIGFAASLLVAVLMILTLSLPPVETNYNMHQAMQAIFMPIPRLFIASLISYLICQQVNIWLFQAIRKITAGKYLWLRTSLSLLISALLDSVIFSFLAWIVFAQQPVSINELIYTYILSTYIFRIIVTLLQILVIYLVRALLNKDVSINV
jgi:uncharacterized integral membrane protein (TIGR00697 family)